MRHIHLGDEFRLRFPRRGEEFNEGVEIGMLAVLMQLGFTEFTRLIAAANMDQARALAAKLGYCIVTGPAESDWVHATFRRAPSSPKLKLIHSRE